VIAAPTTFVRIAGRCFLIVPKMTALLRSLDSLVRVLSQRTSSVRIDIMTVPARQEGGETYETHMDNHWRIRCCSQLSVVSVAVRSQPATDPAHDYWLACKICVKNLPLRSYRSSEIALSRL
jgi:hypothetical protein